MANRIVDPAEAKIAVGLAESATATDLGMLIIAMTWAEGAVRRFLQYDPVYAQRVEYYPTHDGNRVVSDSLWEISGSTLYERRAASGAGDTLQLRHIPVRAISDLRIDYDGRSGTASGAFAAATVKTEGTDFWPNYDMVDTDGNKVCNDGIIKSHGQWPDVAGSIKVTYYGGYKQKELHGQDEKIDASQIWGVCLSEIQRHMIKLHSMKKSVAGFVGPLTSENLGDYSYTADSSLLQRLAGGTDLLPESRDILSSYTNFGHALGM